MARAMFSGVCERCEEEIVRGQEVAPRNLGWIHASCAPGGDDE